MWSPVGIQHPMGLRVKGCPVSVQGKMDGGGCRGALHLLCWQQECADSSSAVLLVPGILRMPAMPTARAQPWALLSEPQPAAGNASPDDALRCIPPPHFQCAFGVRVSVPSDASPCCHLPQPLQTTCLWPLSLPPALQGAECLCLERSGCLGTGKPDPWERGRGQGTFRAAAGPWPLCLPGSDGVACVPTLGPQEWRIRVQGTRVLSPGMQ